jgi:hypothetical protein
MEEQLELHRGLLIRRRESVPKNCPEIDASAPVDHQLQAPRLQLSRATSGVHRTRAGRSGCQLVGDRSDLVHWVLGNGRRRNAEPEEAEPQRLREGGDG